MLDAMILAGGFGTRLRQAVSDRPKVLAEVNGRPFLAFLLDQLSGIGIKRVVLCTGYMAEKVQAAFGGSYGDMELHYSVEVKPLGTGGALRNALELTGSDPLLVMNGDSYCSADLEWFKKNHYDSGSICSLLLNSVPDVARFGSVTVDTEGSLLSFKEKGGAVGPGLINAGLYIINRKLLEALPLSVNMSLERDLFPLLIGKGLCGFAQDARFIDIGVPEDYLAASSFMSEIIAGGIR